MPELADVDFRLHQSNEEQVTVFRPFVLITSNSERSLPEAFLRRCVYYHMQFPEKPGEQDTQQDDDNTVKYNGLLNVINKRIDVLFGEQKHTNFIQQRDAAWEVFWQLRQDSAGLKRKPSTGELLNWLSVVCSPARQGIEVNSEVWKRLACQLLVKQRDDVEQASRILSLSA